MLLEDLNLLEDKNLKAISIFHPVMNFSGERLGGGIFLSSKVLKKMINPILFYDSSRELKRSLDKMRKIETIEVDTRKMNVYDATTYSLHILKPYLRNCKKQVLTWKKKIDQIQIEINAARLKKNKLLFFIDAIKNVNKLPPTILVQDSIVLSLLESKKIRTYKTPLSYVAWSAKKIKNNYGDYIRIGLVNHLNEKLEVQKLDEKNYNVFYRGILIPGVRQLYFLHQFLGLF